MDYETINDEVTMRVGTDPQTGRFRAGASILERYTVLDELGQGGMGVVYRCLDTVGGVEVAVKMLPPEVAHNSDEMDAIRANYQLVANLSHANIAGVRTLEKDARGDYYLVMDLARGENLSRWLRHHPAATEAEKFAILRQIASALDYAHVMKIVHRDVKPENVMVDADGTVMVFDFGLAAEIRSSQSRTSHAVTSKSGTPHYKAPEQWLGRPQRASADIYSFAVLAYKLLFNRLPFEADDLGILGQAVLNAPVPKVPGVHACVNAAFAKGLAKKPKDRFATCAQFVDALEGRVSVKGGVHIGRWVSLLALIALFANGRRAQKTVQLAREKAQQHQVQHHKAKEELDRTKREPQKGKTRTITLPGERTKSEPQKGKTRAITLPGEAKLELVWCPAGKDLKGNEVKGFWMGKTEVTQAQWKSVMGYNPSYFKGDDRPVEQVSWDDCQKFVKKCQDVGVKVRLPTEREWEYACRAGSTGDWGRRANGGEGPLEAMGWYDGNSDSKTHPVAQKEPNAWGIYDMHGNVWEWCEDAVGVRRVDQGGGWNYSSRFCAAGFRLWIYPGDRNGNLGFRIAGSQD